MTETNDYSVEKAVAHQIAHKERIARILAETGGEIIHPDHYRFRMAFRDALLDAADVASDEHGFSKVRDGDLPELFRTIDALAEKLWLRSIGLEG